MQKAYELAKAEVGTVEWRDGDNPRVVAYFRDAGFPGVTTEATAWCAAFVGAMLKRAGMQGTGKLTARSYLAWGRNVPVNEAREGDIAVFERGKAGWQGHVGFVVAVNPATITVLGGNQSDAVSRVAYPRAKLLGIRRDEPVPVVDAAPAQEVPQPDWWGLLVQFISTITRGRK